MSALERRYRRLLRAYPAWYLDDRGEEILGTLLEAEAEAEAEAQAHGGTSSGARSRQWPSPREARTLILGGLRVRSGQDQRLTTAANLRLAVMLAAVVILCDNTGTFVGEPVSRAEVGLALLTVAAVVLAWTGQRRLTGVVALAAAGMWAYWWFPYWQACLVGPGGALILIAALARREPRMPLGWRWPVMALLVDLLVRQLTSGHLMGVATAVVLLLIVGVTIAWTAVDARPMLALILLAEARVWLAGLDTGPWSWDVGTWLSAIVSLAPLMAVFWRLRRQSVL